MNIIAKLVEIHHREGLWNSFVGRIRIHYYRRLQKRFHFNSWHITPYQLRPYAVDVLKLINGMTKSGEINSVCEVGCGIGDILNNIKHTESRIGIDMSEEQIACAKYLSKGRANYYVGTFGDVKDAVSYGKLDLLITVNFIHAIDPNTLKSLYDSIFDHVDVRYIIIDCVDGEGYKYFHNPAVILPQYRIAKTIGTGYTGGANNISA